MCDLTQAQRDRQAEFRGFVDAWLRDAADGFDRDGRMPLEAIARLRRSGYLGALIPVARGGAGFDSIEFGLLNEALGIGCSSLRSLITVHSMVCHALSRWGSESQKARWLPRLASGDAIAGFALTEPRAGSDIGSIESSGVLHGDALVITGRKRWITFGQLADIYLVIAKVGGRPIACLIERSMPGLVITPIGGTLGLRASMLADLEMSGCVVPAENIVGAVGFGLNAVAAAALDLGRYSVAWGCVGIAQACLEASTAYAAARVQFGVPIEQHQLVQAMISDIATNVEAGRLLCFRAGRLRQDGDPEAVVATCVAKYFASTMCAKASRDAVQVQGAHGCSAESSVGRYFRDAKIMEIIEGSTQIQRLLIAQHYIGRQAFIGRARSGRI